MLALDSDRWRTLRHAYGSAANIPELIKAASADPSPTETSQAEPWLSLWSSLCHQDTVSEASYAAVPHLLRIAEQAREPYAWDLLGLPASVEIRRLSGTAPDLPEDVAESYFEAWAAVPAIITKASEWEWDHVFAQAAVAPVVASKGLGQLADAILELGPAATERFLALVDEGEV
jgi:hypothetical protein